MNDAHITDAGLRQFLLGNLEEVERQRIEKLFISDSDWKQRILTAEEDLIEDYLEGALSETQRHQFLAQYASTPQHLRRLQITRLIIEQAKSEINSQIPIPTEVDKGAGFFSKFWPLNVRIMIPAIAVLTIAIVAGIVFLVQFGNKRSPEARQRAAIERELAELNSPESSSRVSAHIISLVLPPVSVRSANSNNEVTLSPDTQLIELRLIWLLKEYSSYRAVVHRVGDSEHYTISNLKLLKDQSGRAVTVKIPTRILRRGLCQIELSGVDQGAVEPSQEYTFTIN